VFRKCRGVFARKLDGRGVGGWLPEKVLGGRLGNTLAYFQLRSVPDLKCAIVNIRKRIKGEKAQSKRQTFKSAQRKKNARRIPAGAKRKINLSQTTYAKALRWSTGITSTGEDKRKRKNNNITHCAKDYDEKLH